MSEAEEVNVDQGAKRSSIEDKSIEEYNRKVTKIIDELSVIVKKATDKFGDSFEVSVFKKRCSKIFRGNMKVSLNDSLKGASLFETSLDVRGLGVPQTSLFGSSSGNAFSKISKGAQASEYPGFSLGVSQLSQGVGSVGHDGVKNVVNAEGEVGDVGAGKGVEVDVGDVGQGVGNKDLGDVGVDSAGKELGPLVCVDAAPLSVSVPIVEKQNRKVKKARSLLSPFKNKEVEIKATLKAAEKKITNFLFSHLKDKFFFANCTEPSLLCCSGESKTAWRIHS